MSETSGSAVPINDYEYQKETYEKQRKIYDDQMRLWETFNQTSSEMDARFDKTLFTIAAGSFGLSFAFIDKIVSLSSAVYLPVLIASWACFSVCLIVMVLGHLLSAETYRRQRDEVAESMVLQFKDKPAEDKVTRDFVSPCNYAALFMYIGGIVCLLLFVLLNL
jgi:ABC-type siderophore export system fused ATPase/permease subunit